MSLKEKAVESLTPRGCGSGLLKEWLKIMCKGLIGKKLGMTSQFSPAGRFVPVTVVEAGPCVVTQVKTVEKDGYQALQLGFGKRSKRAITKPLQGHLKKSGLQTFAALKARKSPPKCFRWVSGFRWWAQAKDADSPA
jgi:hypothetical protein